MGDRRKFAYIAGFIGFCWIATTALIAIFIALAHFLKSTSATITLFLVLLYSCLFGLLGWQVYRWKGRRDGWPSGKPCDRVWKRADKKKINEPEDAKKTGSGWK